MNKPDTIMIDDVRYIREDKASNPASKLDGLERVIIRSYAAGVFIGYLAEKKAEVSGVNVTLKQARRIYYWDGACSLTQLAMEGSKSPLNCKITEAINEQWVGDVIEILPVSQESADIIDGVSAWKK